MIDIKDISGKVLKSVLETSDCRINEELMSLCFISLSWDDDNDMTLPEGSYIERNGEKYQLLEPYNPSFISENAFRYTPVFYDRIALWSKKPCFLVTDSGEETDWSMTAYPGQFMDVIIRALSKYVGETYTYSVDASIAQSTMEYIAFQNKSIFDALTDIANAWESEWWVEGTVIHLSKCQYGDPVVLSVGESTGVPSVTNNKDGYFTRFYAFGSTKNITQDYNDGGFTNGLVNKRLTLNPDKYPGGYIDIRPDLKNDEVFVKTLTFDNIFPSSNLEIVDVRAELREYLDSDGNKIQIGESADGDPLYKQYAIWYFKISDFEFNNSTYDKDENPEGMLLPGLDLSVIFESGQLNSRDFKLTYHADTKEYEIHFIEESGSIIMPGTVSSIPANGDKIVLYNIRMPQEYTLSAQDDLEEALLSEMAKYAKDLNTYTVPSNPVYFNANGLDLNVGQSVTFMFGSRMLSTRVLKVEKRLDYPIEQTITIGEKKIKGNTQEIKEEVIDANQNIDVVKALADLNKVITDGYGRVQQLIIQSMSQYKGMWVLNQNGHPDDPSYWTVETDFQAISRKSLVAYGDVIAKSVDEEIDDAELPKAGYGITNFGLTAIKQGGGLLVDSNNLVYIDPNYAGGGGLDIEQLEQYLTTSGYLKKNDPATSLLMTGYVKAGAYSPIQATDNLSVAIGKLEKHYDDYVTLATAQTITGAKIFTQDIIGQRDIIAKSTSEAIADAELPIASKTQLGLIKVGSGFEIAADGTLNNTGTGGLTEVYWNDIKGEPPFANKSHTHTVSQITDLVYNGKNTEIDNYDLNYAGRQIWFTEGSTPIPDIEVTNGGILAIRQAYGLSTQLLTSGSKLYTRYKSSTGSWTKWKTIAYTTDNVASASKLNPGCKIWGQAFTGGSDITGNLTNVGNITSSNSAFVISKSGIGSNYIMQSLAGGQLNINAHDGNVILFGYRGTSGYQFYAGTGGGDSVGSHICQLDTDKLYLKVPLGIKTASPQAELHVIGDGLFTGDVIAKSTSTAISDAELPIASASTLGLIKVGSGLKITNGVLSVTGGSGGGGSIVTWGTTSNGVARLTVDGTYKDVSLSGHTHSQYLTSHQTIYSLTIKQNGTTIGTYKPNSDDATINITTSSGGGAGWASGTYSDNAVCRVNNTGGGGLAFWNDTEKTGLRVGGGNGIKGYNDTYGHLGNLFFNYVSSSVNVKVDAYGKIYSNGTALSSDLRLKEVVGYESDVLERMTKIPVIKFYRKDVGDNVQTTGFGAQSFQGIFDNVTILNKDSGYYMISETSILGITFQGVKELYGLQKQTTSEIDVLKQRIALLEAENQNLWNIINEKEAA